MFWNFYVSSDFIDLDRTILNINSRYSLEGHLIW